MFEGRHYFRLRKELPLTWTAHEQQVSGQGKISNISLTGMQFETDRSFKAEHGLIMGFQSTEIPALPQWGKLVWFRKRAGGDGIYKCGIRFMKKDGALSPSWNQWMEENILKLADATENNILSRYLDFEN